MKRARVFIPHDVIFDILQRLPAKSILRFRAACKSWSSLISDPYFLHSHARRAKSSVLLTRYTESSPSLHLRPICSTNTTQSTTLEVRRPGLSLLASCDGLLCLQGMSFNGRGYHSPGYYYVCNPLTDEWITLPQSRFITGFLCAFYYHPSMKQYRLLRCSPNGYEILTIGAKEWRRITCVVDGTVSPFLELYFLYSLPIILNKPPIPMHGKLHYQLRGTSFDWLIVMFDINCEKFEQMSLPESCRTNEWTIREARLIELEGKLGVSTVASSDATLDIWMLEDYEKQVWVKRYRVTTPEIKFVTWFKPLVVSDDGEALVNWRGDLVLYDFKHHACRKITIEDDFRMTNLLYKESLVRHDFFETGYQTGFITNSLSYLLYLQLQ